MADIDYTSYANPAADKLLVVKFYPDAKENKHASLKAGRPVFDDIEMCEIIIPGDRSRTLLVPALAEWKRFGTTRVTYAERFKDHYARYKANEGPVVEGTPLSEAPFLTMGQRASYKALDIYTVEQLAALSGQGIKNLGVGGLAVVQQAKAYLSAASSTADTAAMLIRIEELEAQLRESLKPKPLEDDAVTGANYELLSVDDLKAHIEARTGSRPRGNPSQQTLVAMAYDLDREDAETAAA
jgi:hypothetical protein